MEVAHLSLGDWSWEPTVVLGIAAAAAAYAIAWRRGLLRADDDVRAWVGTPRTRCWFFGAGLLVGFIALLSPLDTGGDLYLFSLHMVQHLLLMMVAPPLCILGLVGMRPLRASPPGGLRRLWAVLVNPWSATLIFSAVLLVWHVPALYDATLTTEPIHVFEHLSFIAVGVLFWWPIIDPMRGRAAHCGRDIRPRSPCGARRGFRRQFSVFLHGRAPRPFYRFSWRARASGDDALSSTNKISRGGDVSEPANPSTSPRFVAVPWRIFGEPAQGRGGGAARARLMRCTGPAWRRPSPTIGGTSHRWRRDRAVLLSGRM